MFGQRGTMVTGTGEGRRSSEDARGEALSGNRTAGGRGGAGKGETGWIPARDAAWAALALRWTGQPDHLPIPISPPSCALPERYSVCPRNPLPRKGLRLRLSDAARGVERERRGRGAERRAVGRGVSGQRRAHPPPCPRLWVPCRVATHHILHPTHPHPPLGSLPRGPKYLEGCLTVLQRGLVAGTSWL